MPNTHIYSAGSELGPYKVQTSDLIKEARLDRFGISPTYVQEVMGISHVVQCDNAVKPGDLAIAASRKAIEQSPVSIKEIDMVLYCGIERNGTEPATAHYVAHAVGIDPDNLRYCWDVSNACHGFTAGLITAQSFIDSGLIRYALLCTGERSSTKTNYITNEFRKGILGEADIADTLGAFSVGDAGGAMIVGPSEDGTGIQHVSNRVLSRFTNLCHFTNFGLDCGIQPTYAMKMPEICARTIREVKNMVPIAMAKLGWSPGDIDHAIFHQVGTRVFNAYVDILGIKPERAIATYGGYGNLASATVPVIWDKLTSDNILKKGERVFVISTGSPVVVSQLGITV